MKLALSLLGVLFLSVNTYAQLTISGKIKDEKSQLIPFASIYVKNTTIGTSANSEGEYSLQVKPGEYEVLYKAVGYHQESRKLAIKTSQIVNVTLITENYQLKDVTIYSGEDPAYSIMRKAIKKRKTYLNEVKAYTCEVYIKGLQKLLAAPKKFLGRDIDQVGREIGLDSNRRGIVYLSESESKYSYQYPNNVHEEMISSKVSGRNRAFSFNRATDMKVNFYENSEDWPEISNRPLVSPVAQDAMLYYNYKLLGESVENGETICKIRVTPKRNYDPCFQGIIYILKNSWRIYGLNLYITKKANINFVDTLKVDQQFFPVGNKTWMTSSSKLEFTGGIFGFKFGGYFISVYKNYDLNPTFNKKEFAEVLRITKQVNKKDSAYWEQERPIPLTEEEKTDYIKKDKLAKRRESKEYLDSLDRVHNKFKFSSLLMGGINTRNRYKKEYYHFDSLLGSLLYNTVEGFALNYGASFTKQIDTVTNRYMQLGAKVRYGFSNHLLNGSINATLPVKTFRLNINAGSDVVDLNNHVPISPFINSLYSLLERQNYEKLYQKDFTNISFSGRITGGWQASA
ncbi:MAG: carboxypeptidase-like regulatory protein, partial [Mucilaginibacter sp.]|nr:carboxypeptidase-like regulatory protein [Mucilaginibacter sp.]